MDRAGWPQTATTQIVPEICNYFEEPVVTVVLQKTRTVKNQDARTHRTWKYKTRMTWGIQEEPRGSQGNQESQEEHLTWLHVDLKREVRSWLH